MKLFYMMIGKQILVLDYWYNRICFLMLMILICRSMLLDLIIFFITKLNFVLFLRALVSWKEIEVDHGSMVSRRTTKVPGFTFYKPFLFSFLHRCFHHFKFVTGLRTQVMGCCQIGLFRATNYSQIKLLKQTRLYCFVPA